MADGLTSDHIEMMMNDSVPWRMYSNFPPLYFAGPQRQAWCRPFQGLDASHLVGARASKSAIG